MIFHRRIIQKPNKIYLDGQFIWLPYLIKLNLCVSLSKLTPLFSYNSEVVASILIEPMC